MTITTGCRNHIKEDNSPWLIKSQQMSASLAALAQTDAPLKLFRQETLIPSILPSASIAALALTLAP